MLNFDSDVLRDVLKDVCELTNTVITLFDDNKNDIFSMPYPSKHICKNLRIIKKLDDKCKKCDNDALNHACESRSPYIYRCHMGMTEAVLPIIQDDKIIGYITLGKVVEEKNIPFLKQQIRNCCKIYNLPETELLSEIDKMPIIKHDTLTACTNILGMLSDYLLLNNIIKPSSPPLHTQIHDYIIKNISADLTVKTLCSYFKISKSMLYNISVDHYGCGISEYIKKLRIEGAKRLLGTSMNITQVAEAVGIPDAGYFIKIFKKETGCTPLKYKKLSAANSKYEPFNKLSLD